MIALFRTGLLTLCCSLFLFCTAEAQTRGNNLQKDILYYTNKFRSSKGLQPLILNDVASNEAANHSRNMARKKTSFGHKAFDKRTRRIRQELGFGRAFAENVAYGNLDAAAVVDLWINSPGHRKNLLGSFQYIGIGIAEARDGTPYFTQIFLSK